MKIKHFIFYLILNLVIDLIIIESSFIILNSLVTADTTEVEKILKHPIIFKTTIMLFVMFFIKIMGSILRIVKKEYREITGYKDFTGFEDLGLQICTLLLAISIISKIEINLTVLLITLCIMLLVILYFYSMPYIKVIYKKIKG